ncbi:MAG: hypothetical protein O2794_01015 [bacterium]|nr:hypothetical protein [bacterium]
MKRLQALMNKGWSVEYDKLYPEKNGGHAWGLCDEDTKTVIIDPRKHSNSEEMWDTFIHEYLHVIHPGWRCNHKPIKKGVQRIMAQDGEFWWDTLSLENAVPQLKFLIRNNFRVICMRDYKGEATYDLLRHTIILNPLKHSSDDELLDSLLVNYIAIRYPQKTDAEGQKTSQRIMARMRAQIKREHQ